MNAAWSALINGAILSALLAAAVWLALRVAPGRTCNAATRYLVWWLALAFALLLPVLCGLKARSRAGIPRDTVSPSGAPRVPALRHVPAPAMRQEFWALPSGVPALEIRGGLWQRWLLAIWLVSSVLLLLRLACSYRSLVRAGAEAEDAPDDLRRRAPAWSAALGMDAGCLRVACSPSVSIPVALGPRRRTILIPVHLLAELDGEELDHVGLHEAAHLARRDDLALLAQRVIEALFCLHPVVRWISRRIDLEREIACDDLAVAATRNPRTYAACLTRMVELCGGVRESLAAANFAHGAHISQRVELIMKQTRNFTPQPLASRFGAFALAICALAAILVNRPALVAFAAPQTLPAAAPRPVMLLFFDTSTMTTATLALATERASTLASQQMTDGQQAAVAIYHDGRLRVRQDFTADRGLIEWALRGLTEIPGSPSDSSGRLATIQAAIEMVKPLSGKKRLVYFTGGPRPAAGDSAQLAAVIDEAVRANVAIYSIDAHTAQAH